MEETVSVRSFVRKTRKVAIFSGLIIGLFLASFWSHLIGFGFLAGVLVSIVNFQLMAVDAFEIEEKTPKRARKFIIGRYAIRYAIMFGFLALVATRTDLNIIAAFTGIFFIPALLLIGQFFRAINIDSRIFKG